MAYRPFSMSLDMKELQLWPGGPVLEQHDGVFPLGTDSVLLADFCHAPQRGSFCDIGSGTGFLSLRLLWERPELSGTAVEVSDAAAENTRQNLLRNGVADRCTVLQGDIREKSLFPQGNLFDLIVSNPPYFPAESLGSSAARQERTLTFPALCAVAHRLLRFGGRFCVVHRTERLCELLSAMSAAGLEPKRLRFVQARVDTAPGVVLLEGRKGAAPGMLTEPVLLLRQPDGRDTEEYRRIYKLEAEA